MKSDSVGFRHQAFGQTVLVPGFVGRRGGGDCGERGGGRSVRGGHLAVGLGQLLGVDHRQGDDGGDGSRAQDDPHHPDRFTDEEPLGAHVVKDPTPSHTLRDWNRQ